MIRLVSRLEPLALLLSVWALFSGLLWRVEAITCTRLAGTVTVWALLSCFPGLSKSCLTLFFFEF